MTKTILKSSRCASIASIISLSLPLHATPLQGGSGVSVAAPIGGGDLLNMGISMLIVVGAVVALGWLYSRLRFNGGGAGNPINIVASRGLGPKERLLLVQIADQQLLIGLTASNVQTLHTFDKPVATEHAMSDASGFAERLRATVRSVVRCDRC